MLGLKSFRIATSIISRIEAMQIIKKGNLLRGTVYPKSSEDHPLTI